jgi:Insertion element 4 transposase N-terminal
MGSGLNIVRIARFDRYSNPAQQAELVMARTKAELGDGARLADYLSVSVLACVYPSQRVHEALNAHDCNSQRIRRFPAAAGVYYAIALSLYPQASYEAVFSAVAEGLAWAAGASPPEPVAKSSISELRSRIGAEPLRDLMRTCCIPLAQAAALPQASSGARSSI